MPGVCVAYVIAFHKIVCTCGPHSCISLSISTFPSPFTPPMKYNVMRLDFGPHASLTECHKIIEANIKKKQKKNEYRANSARGCSSAILWPSASMRRRYTGHQYYACLSDFMSFPFIVDIVAIFAWRDSAIQTALLSTDSTMKPYNTLLIITSFCVNALQSTRRGRYSDEAFDMWMRRIAFVPLCCPILLAAYVLNGI